MATTMPVTSNQVPADEELMYELSRGRQEALEALHHRYAPRVFGLAAQTLDRATAEEIVQEIFLAVWRNAGTFDPARGRFRPWVFQIAHYRVLNEHRRRRRQPQLVKDPESLGMADLPDPAPDPGEIVGRGEERATMRAAVEALPPAQRRAVDLAFFEDLTHEQVATELDLPLGTAKTRIRAGLRQLRANLVGARGGGAGACRTACSHAEQAARALGTPALVLFTSRETAPIRLGATPGVRSGGRAVHRGTDRVDLSCARFARRWNRWVFPGTFYEPVTPIRHPSQSGVRCWVY